MEKVSILGTEYTIETDVDEKQDPKLESRDGFCDFSTKQIKISTFDKDNDSIEDLDLYKRRVLRHEILHAFLYESGLDSECPWAINEEMIDWLAIQYPKICTLFAEINISN